MDIEVAAWLAEMVQQAAAQLSLRPGLTIEVDDNPGNWVQIIPRASEQTGHLNGYLLNFPYRAGTAPPEEKFAEADISLPPGSEIVAWESGGYITLHIRSDIPLVALALFAGDILQKLGGAPADYEVNVQVMHGL